MKGRFRQMARVARESGFKTSRGDEECLKATFSRKDFPSEVQLWSFDQTNATLEYSLALDVQGVRPQRLLAKVADNARILSDVTRDIKKTGYTPNTALESDGYLDVSVGIRVGKRGPNLNEVGKLLRVIDSYLGKTH